MTLYMPLFRASTTLRTLKQLQSHLTVTGLHNDPQASTKLIDSFAHMGSLQSSKSIFNTFQNPDSFMWGVFIKCHVWSHLFEEAISLYQSMLYSECEIGGFIFPSVLRACTGLGDLGVGTKVHGRIVKAGFDSDKIIETCLVNMYGELGCLIDARKVFDEMPVKDLVSWSSVLSGYVNNGEITEGLEMFRSMVSEGVGLDSVTVLSIAEACGDIRSLRLARSVHGSVFRIGIDMVESLNSALIAMYDKCDDLYSAERLFSNVDNLSVSSWTAMITCYNRNHLFRQALEVFVKIGDSVVEPNSVTMMSVLSSCAGLGWLREGKSVHCYVLKNDMDVTDGNLELSLVEFYAECGKLSYCENVLHAGEDIRIQSRNKLISVYAQQGLLEKALLQFSKMLKQGITPDSFTLSSFLSASASTGSLLLGLQLHGHVIKRCFHDEFIQNSLVDMYSKCGCIDLAYSTFDEIDQPGVVSWNFLISGYHQNGNLLNAIALFDKMYLERREMDEVTFLCAIQACSDLGHLEKGKWLHHKLIICGVPNDLYIETALTDMYAKCGDLQAAQRVFDCMTERSVVTWSVMIAGYGAHGHVEAVSSLFSQMLELGTKPNEITFMNILSACSHSGNVEEGKLYFDLMEDFRVERNAEHFACMVDLLSRAGDLNGAYSMLKSMPFPADASTWSALINGCRIHRRMDMIQTIETDLLNIRTDDTGYYTLLSNIFAAEENWSEFTKLRSMVKGMHLKKVPGYSTVEVDNRVYRFGAGDTFHRQIKEINSFLENFQSLAQERQCDLEEYDHVSFACKSRKDAIGNDRAKYQSSCVMSNCSGERSSTNKSESLCSWTP